VTLWNIQNGQQGRHYQGQSDTVQSLAFSPDGQLLAAGNFGGTIDLWLVSDGGRLRTLKGPGSSTEVGSLAFTPDGQILAASTVQGLQLWRLSDGSLLRTMAYTGRGKVTVSPDGTLVAAGLADGTLHIWRVSDGQLVVRPTAHKQAIGCLTFSPDGRQLISGSLDGEVRYWGVEDSTWRFLRQGGFGMTTCALSSDGRLVARSARTLDGPNMVVQLHALPDGSELGTVPTEMPLVSELLFTPPSKETTGQVGGCVGMGAARPSPRPAAPRALGLGWPPRRGPLSAPPAPRLGPTLGTALRHVRFIDEQVGRLNNPVGSGLERRDSLIGPQQPPRNGATQAAR
jgi:hypothetical protein